MKAVVAIDGPAGAGKSSVSRALARQLGYRYVDSGAMYRVIGVLAAERGLALDDGPALAALCAEVEVAFEDTGEDLRVVGNRRDLSAAIRTAAAAQLASKVSVVPAVRECLISKQRVLAQAGGVVMEGRDIGTVVCPQATVKVFLEATPRVRARRRALELQARGETVDVEQTAKEIGERDARDRTRAHSPLRPARDAVVVDTTSRSLVEVIAAVTALVRQRCGP